MASHRFEIDTTAGPAREGILGGGAMLLVRVRMFDGPGVVDGATGQPAGEKDVYTDLRPQDARALALGLLEHGEEAEQLSAQPTGGRCRDDPHRSGARAPVPRPKSTGSRPGAPGAGRPRARGGLER